MEFLTISPIFRIIGNNKTNVGFNFTNFIYFYNLHNVMVSTIGRQKRESNLKEIIDSNYNIKLYVFKLPSYLYNQNLKVSNSSFLL